MHPSLLQKNQALKWVYLFWGIHQRHDDGFGFWRQPCVHLVGPVRSAFEAAAVLPFADHQPADVVELGQFLLLHRRVPDFFPRKGGWYGLGCRVLGLWRWLRVAGLEHVRKSGTRFK